MAARAVIVGLIVLALVNPPFTASSDDVTTVFVVDVSASMGESAKDAARAWVESAITEAGGGQWAVVEFGSDARVGTPVGTEAYRRARGVETEATNLARGLRLGESVLTGETRQRVVLVSDGRGNTGDLQAEIDRLKTLGIVVDVHTVSGADVNDAAVSAVDMPSSVNAGESFEVVVEVLSTITGTAIVELSDDDGLEVTQEVDLDAGGEPGHLHGRSGRVGSAELHRSRADAGRLDRRERRAPRRCRGRGPASVLIVEGEADAGQILEESSPHGGWSSRESVSRTWPASRSCPSTGRPCSSTSPHVT